MNPIKIIINNFERLRVESFNRTKIIIADFPKITGLVFLTRIYAISKLKAQILLRWVSSTSIYTIIKVKASISSRLVILSQVYAVSKIKFGVIYRLYLEGQIYVKTSVIMRILCKLVGIQSPIYLQSLVTFRSLYYYKIYERRDMLIQDCRDMTIQDFISAEIE